MGFSDGAAMSLVLLMQGAFFVLIVALLFLRWHVRRRRRAHLIAWATENGWTYTATDPSLVTRWGSEPFQRGRRRRAEDVARGEFAGRPALTMHYQYTTGSGKSRQVHEFHVMVLSMRAPLPALRLTRDGAGAAIAKAFGGQDVTFESVDFNKRWRVQGAPRWAHEVIHPRMMERLLAPDTAGLTIAIDGSEILAVRSGGQDVGAIAPGLTLLSDIVDLVPAYVWHRAGSRG